MVLTNLTDRRIFIGKTQLLKNEPENIPDKIAARRSTYIKRVIKNGYVIQGTPDGAIVGADAKAAAKKKADAA